MEPAIKPIMGSEAIEIFVSVYIAAAVRATQVPNINRDHVYEWAKDKIAELNPTADEYERAIKLLTEALKI